MARISCSPRAMGLVLWIFLFLPGICVYCEINVFNLRRATGLACQTLALGDSWLSSTAAACFAKCTTRFPDTCKSIVYNSDTKNCTPGSIAFGPMKNIENDSIPAVNSSDVIYYSLQPIPTCNTAGGVFKLYEVCGVTACLHLNHVTAKYAEALSNCSALNSGIFLGNTFARFSIFWHVSLNYLKNNTWFSVIDIDVEGTYVWQNGDPVTEQQAKLMWVPGYPNSWTADEDCTEARHYHWPGVFGLNDEECYWHRVYMCEPYDAYFTW